MAIQIKVATVSIEDEPDNYAAPFVEFDGEIVAIGIRQQFPGREPQEFRLGCSVAEALDLYRDLGKVLGRAE